MTISRALLIRIAAILFLLTLSVNARESQTTSDATVESFAVGDANGPSEPKAVLRIGTKLSPPFAIKNPDGSWTGISIELWKHICGELDLEYALEEHPLDEILSKLESGELDAAVAAISVTSARHKRVAFCHPHYSTGLGVAVSARERSSVWTLLRRIVSSRLLVIIASMTGIVLVSGFLFWLFERKLNKQMFGEERRHGIGMGVWWSTILLLGHKGIIPVSTLGRFLATFAMMSSLVLLSILTGVITSILTVQQLDPAIARATDLHRVRVATVASSTGGEYLKQRRILFREYESPYKALQALDEGEADVVVYDQALLKYLAGHEFLNRIDILPVLFNVQEYSIALRPDSPLKKALNGKLLQYRESDAWDELLYRYLGAAE